MKSSKKVLAFALAAAMVVTAVPATNAQAASTAKLSAKKATVYSEGYKTVTVKTPKSWKSVKVTATSNKKSVAKVKKTAAKKIKVTGVKPGTAKVTVKVTYKTSTKKNAKAKTKKLTYTMKVAKASVALSGDSVVAVGDTTTLTTTKKASKRATITYTSSDDSIATVSEDGTVKGVKAGKATITATLKIGKDTATATQDVEVKKAIVKSAGQTEYNKIEATIVGDTKDIKAGDVKVTNTATKATVAVKSVSLKKGTQNVYVIETFTGMTDAKEYSVEYAGSIAAFTATDGTVAGVALTKTEVPAGIKTEVKAVTKDAKGVVLGYFDLTNGNTTKGQVTTALTITKGYVQRSDVYLPAVGDTMVAKLTYHTGSFAADGTETGKIEETATITAVDPSTVSYNYAVTFGTSAPTWTASSFKAVTAIKVGDASKKAYFRITDENGKEIDSYAGYTVETADPTKLVVNAAELTNIKTTGTSVKGVAAGDTYILVKKDGKVVFSLPVQVQGKATATTVDLNKTSVTVMSGKAVSETIEAKLKDQYNEDMAINTSSASEQPKVEALACPDGTTAPVLAYGTDVIMSGTKKVVVSVDGTKFAGKKLGTYTYKITLKDADKKAIVRTFTVNFVDNAAVQAYQLALPTEMDTTVKADTTTDTGYDVVVNVVETANGAAIGNYAGSEPTATATTSSVVTYAVKDASGKDVSSDYYTQSGNTLTIKTVSASGASFQKNLAAGTYYVTATFKAKTKKADGTYDATSTLGDVAVSGSFTVKDTQDTAAQINVKKNDLGNQSVTSALQNKTYVEITYDGVLQTISTSDVHKVNGTVAGNTAYVTSVEVFVQLTNTRADGTHNKVLITIPVNQQFTNVNGSL
ncbi:MAG: Ig domain-containing protein [Roseburia sp.]